MNLDKKIISEIWDGCEKQIVDGYVYIKMDDLIKLETEEILNPTVKVKEVMSMNKVANYLNNKGFKYNTDGKIESWIKK
jgi:hypothetical protein|tara:strand:+ start:151 stop:387 length:237 start_codon:yes stop_codon:yes gene_type:complete